MKAYQLIVLSFVLGACGSMQKKSDQNLSDISCSENSYKRTLPLFTAKIMENPDAAAPLYELARCYYESNDFHRAIYYLDLAMKKENKGQYFSLKGNSLFHLGRWDQSISNFEQALKLEPGNSWASVNLGQAFFAQGKLKEAEALWSSVKDAEIQKHPTFLVSLYRLALEKKDEAKIIERFQALPDSAQEKFEWKYPYVKVVIANADDEMKKKFYQDLKSAAGNKTQDLALVQELEKAYPVRTIASQN